MIEPVSGAADDRHQAFLEGERPDDQLRCIPHRRVQEPPERRTEVGPQRFGGAADDLGKWHDRDRSHGKNQERVCGGPVEPKRDRNEDQQVVQSSRPRIRLFSSVPLTQKTAVTPVRLFEESGRIVQGDAARGLLRDTRPGSSS